MVQDLRFTIQLKAATLSEAEQLVAYYVLANSDEVIHLSTQQLAQKVGVSNATITRFCKSIGAKGFPDFKIILSAEQSTPATILEEIKPTDSLDQIKQQLRLRITNALSETETLVQNEAIVSGSKLIHQANDIVIFGIGASYVIAKDLAQKFIRIGKLVLDTQDTHLIISALSSRPKGKLMILISNSGEKKEIDIIAKVCNELSIPIISIVSNAASSLARKSTVSLVHSQSEQVDSLRSAATASLIAQHYIVDLLYYHYLAVDYEQHIEKLKITYNYVQKSWKE